MTKINDGGPAFPALWHEDHYASKGMSLRDWFAGQASEPSADWMRLMRDMDQNSNPHNDPHKPRRRSDFELTAVWKYKHADAMLAARNAGGAE